VGALRAFLPERATRMTSSRNSLGNGFGTIDIVQQHLTAPQIRCHLSVQQTQHHDRVLADRIDTDGKLTLRVNGRLHHIRMGRTLARTPVLKLVQDLNVRIIDAATGELLRELTIDQTRTTNPPATPATPTETKSRTLRVRLVRDLLRDHTGGQGGVFPQDMPD